MGSKRWPLPFHRGDLIGLRRPESGHKAKYDGCDYGQGDGKRKNAQVEPRFVIQIGGLKIKRRIEALQQVAEAHSENDPEGSAYK